jgi:predicted anti-sigma-YlaC factor YlaD
MVRVIAWEFSWGFSWKFAWKFRLALLLLVAASSGCSLRHIAADHLGEALSSGGMVFASDDDPELIRAATPFSLKLMESVLAERPQHAELLTATARGYTQYAYAFLQQEADEVEDRDVAAAYRLRDRARKLYRRARDYGMRALEASHPGFSAALKTHPAAALNGTSKADVPQLYWSGVSWALMIALSKDDPDAVADVPLMAAMMARALTLDEAFDSGALHAFMISFAMAGSAANGSVAAREHFRRAVELSGGRQAGPYVSLAEAVAVPARNRREFESLLAAALKIDPDAAPEWRLANTLMQRRAQWLLARTDQLFTE